MFQNLYKFRNIRILIHIKYKNKGEAKDLYI